MPAAMDGPPATTARRVFAGIDEAGFGPLLGPLVIGASAWSIPDDSDGTDLWDRLRSAVSRKPAKRQARLAINDSKKLYSTAKGIGELERGVLGTLLAQHGVEGGSEGGGAGSTGSLPIAFTRFLDRQSPGWVEHVAGHPWYDARGTLQLPVEVDAADIATRANGLRVAMGRCGVTFLGVGLEVIPEGRYNRLYDAMGNKSRMLFSCTARLIQRLLDRFGRAGLTVVCDKQGGRHSYRQILQDHWNELHIKVLDESPERSAYVLSDPPGEGGAGRSMEIRFVPKADVDWLPVALASMYCKYTRELFMRLLNAFWQAKVPGPLKATAGYYTDGMRFVGEVAEAARGMGIGPDQYQRRA
ncbi:MAG: hypothetical protein BIFFINMI_02306 [Phycisphaerae bacterium]|nr:hypothetical protein [Phycisphaerae bacterium]